MSHEDGDLVFRTPQAMIDGHLYATLLTGAITNTAGQPLVPSPVTVFLRSRGALVDAEGRSTLSDLPDQDAAMLEAGRRS